MKKVLDILKPNILIVLGALIFLSYFNNLALREYNLAIGIIAIVIASYYIAIGVLGILIGNKFNDNLKKIFEIIAISLFGVFMFLNFLFDVITTQQVYAAGNRSMAPGGWTIGIYGMLASLAFLAFYIVARFVNKDNIKRLAYLFSALFALALLLNILFFSTGDSRVLGNISIVMTAIHASFLFYLFNSLSALESEPKAAKEEAKEEPKAEEKPAEEENKEESAE